MCYRTSFRKRWESINDKISHSLTSLQSSMFREIHQNALAEGPIPENRLFVWVWISWYFIQFSFFLCREHFYDQWINPQSPKKTKKISHAKISCLLKSDRGTKSIVSVVPNKLSLILLFWQLQKRLEARRQARKRSIEEAATVDKVKTIRHRPHPGP